MEFSSRRARFGELMAEWKLDAYLVTAPPNIAYLTGFTGSNGLLAIGQGRAVLLTDPRYEIQAPRQTDCPVRVVRGALAKAAGVVMRRWKCRKIGFESTRIDYATLESLRQELGLGKELIAAGGGCEKLRMVKSKAEIERIRASVRLCSTAFKRTMRRVRVGMKEYELAAELDHRMRLLGAEGPAFDTIAASGAQTALPHAAPTGKALKTSELLLIDMGARLRGYASDMTRMACLGRPTRKARRIHQAVLEAQLAAVDRVRAGLTAGAVDQAARRVLKRHGLGNHFVHSTGHGLGLEIHEQPRVGKGDRTRLEAGMVITIEPGAYLEGFGGVRIEDTVVVTRTGCEVLTPTPKELLTI